MTIHDSKGGRHGSPLVTMRTEITRDDKGNSVERYYEDGILIHTISFDYDKGYYRKKLAS